MSLCFKLIQRSVENDADRLCCTERLKAKLTIIPEASPDGFFDGDSMGIKADQDRNAELENSDLTIEVLGHELLAAQLHAVQPLAGGHCKTMSRKSWPLSAFYGDTRSCVAKRFDRSG